MSNLSTDAPLLYSIVYELIDFLVICCHRSIISRKHNQIGVERSTHELSVTNPSEVSLLEVSGHVVHVVGLQLLGLEV